MKIESLYQKVKEFEESLSKEAKSLSHCQAGCSRCCYTDLSIFSLEADHIRSWFNNLSEAAKHSLKSSWEKPLTTTENFHGDVVYSCTFLLDERCTIYEARPLICRTQGLAFSFKVEDKSMLDICPLNEGMLEELTSTEVMNLDLLNTILARMEADHTGGSGRERISLSALKLELSR